MQGARLLGTGTLSFLENLAGGTFIRVGTLIRNSIVLKQKTDEPYRKKQMFLFSCNGGSSR